MKLGGIFCVAQLLGSCIAYPLAKRAKPQLMPLLSDDIWNEMLEWQSVWLASNDFQSLGIDEDLVSKINGFLHFSEAFLRKAYNDQHQQVQDLCVLNVKQSKLKKIKTNVTKWKGKLNDIMQIRKDIKMDQKQGKMKPDRLIGELDKLKNIVASYVEQTNNLPIVTILRIVAANLDHQMVKLRELIEKQGENLDKNTEDMLQQTENVIRIAEMLIRTVDEIRATSVDQFIQDNVGDVNMYLGALNDVQYNDSMAIVNEMNNAEISQENEYAVEDYVYKHATSRIKKVFTWFNATTSVPSDFYFKHNNKQITLISLKLFSYIAYQTIGGTMYCILELATPKSISAWDNCGNFHSAQLRKEWILLSVLLTRISNPLKNKDPSAFALGSTPDLLCQ